MRYLLSLLLCLSLTVPTLAKTSKTPRRSGTSRHIKKVKHKKIKPASQNKYKHPKAAKRPKISKAKNRKA